MVGRILGLYDHESSISTSRRPEPERLFHVDIHIVTLDPNREIRELSEIRSGRFGLCWQRINFLLVVDRIFGTVDADI